LAQQVETYTHAQQAVCTTLTPWPATTPHAACTLCVSSRPRACCCALLCLLQVITKLLYLLHQGETFTKARLWGW
jgi:hypothetical protein